LLEFESACVKYNIMIFICLKGSMSCLEHIFQSERFCISEYNKNVLW
jgi:hypothetical protein